MLPDRQPHQSGAVVTEPLTTDPVLDKAVDNLLEAADLVLAFDWSDNDMDARVSIEKLRQALDEYRVVWRLSQ